MILPGWFDNQEGRYILLLDSNSLICSFVFPHAIVTLFYLRACDIALCYDIFRYLDQFSIKFLNRLVLSLAAVLVFYYFIQVSSCISSLLWIRGIFVSLLYDVFFYWCIGLLEILQFISFQSNHCFSIVTVIADLQIWTSKCVRFTSVITSIVVSIKWNLFL